MLAGRHVAKKAPHSWYRTIDKVHDELIRKPKLLLQDMRSTIYPVIEHRGAIHTTIYTTSRATAGILRSWAASC